MDKSAYFETALKIRTEWGMEDMQRDRNIPLPENISCFYDIPYGDDSHWQIADIYLPDSASTSFPVIVSVHGGGWIYSHKEYYRTYCASLTSYGFAVVNFNYRLAPEHPYPASLEDINALFTWLLLHGNEYRLDIHRICAVGDSAGAQMLSQYLVALSNPDYSVPFKVPQGLTVHAAAFNCGVYDLTEPSLIAGKDSNRPYLEAYFCGEPENHYKEVDIFPYLNQHFPPSYVMTSSYDFLQDKALPFYDLLKSKHVICEYHLYGNKNTPELIHVFHCDLKLPAAHECNRDECRFFNQILNMQHNKAT